MLMEDFSETQTHSNLESMMESFVATKTLINEELRNKNLLTNDELKQFDTKVDNVITHSKMLETHISQISQQQAASFVMFSSFLGKPEQNPRDIWML